MTPETAIWVLLIAAIVLAVLLVLLLWQMRNVKAQLHTLANALPAELPGTIASVLNDAQATTQNLRHREMLTDMADGLAKQGDRIAQSQLDAGERLRSAVGLELIATRESVAKLQLDQSQSLGALTQALIQKQDALKSEMLAQTLEKIAEQSRMQTEQMQATMRLLTQQISERVEMLTKTNNTRLAEISGKVTERLDEGFKKTNETFVSVMTRLATIDEAQKKLDGLTTNVVSLQQLLGDKKSRGAFGEMQLEQIIRNMLPETAYEFQYNLSHAGKSVKPDCMLKMPDPVGMIAVDSKFPLENYERMVSDDPDKVSPAVFKAGVKKHIEDIASKYIIPGVTSDGAMMFVPAEAVFAEIHARHRDVVEYAQQRRVWIVSPTTLMAILNTMRAVLKDVETRKQVHIIKDELGKLGKEFGRFDERMRKLAEHIRQANKDVDDVAITSKKISDRFQSIERVELDAPAVATLQNAVQPDLLSDTKIETDL